MKDLVELFRYRRMEWEDEDTLPACRAHGGPTSRRIAHYLWQNAATGNFPLGGSASARGPRPPNQDAAGPAATTPEGADGS